MGANQFPNVPDVAGVFGAPQSNAQQPSDTLGGLAYGGSKTRAVGLVASALQGIREGYVQRQMQEYDKLQLAYNQARQNYELNQKALQENPNDPMAQHWSENMAASYKNMEETYNQILGKFGGEKGTKGQTPEQQSAREKIGHVLKKVLLPQPVNIPNLTKYSLPGGPPHATPPTFPQAPQVGAGAYQVPGTQSYGI